MSASSSHVSFKPGDIIFEEKSLADYLMIVQKGEVGVFKSDEDGKLIPITVVESNHFLGEIAMAKGRYRTSTAIALTHVSLIRVSKDEFDRQIKMATPWLRALFMNLVDRMQETNEVLKRNHFVDSQVVDRIQKRKEENPGLAEKMETLKLVA